jgi:uncharacterized protein YjbI with pentapeptide repeats
MYPARGQHELTLARKNQDFSGADVTGAKLTSTRLRGEDIDFALLAAGGRHVFTGCVTGDSTEGTVELAGGKGVARWTAQRVKA